MAGETVRLHPGIMPLCSVESRDKSASVYLSAQGAVITRSAFAQRSLILSVRMSSAQDGPE